MIALKVREILSRHNSSDTDCARALVEAFGNCDNETLEDAFVVSFRTGTLDQARAQRLLLLIDELSGDEDALKTFSERADDMSRLKSETDELIRQRRALEARSQSAAALQLQLHNLALETDQSMSDAVALRQEIDEMIRQIERLNTILSEVQSDAR